MAKKKQTTEREILTIDENQYYLDSVSEEGKILLNNINIITEEIKRLDIQTNIARLAYTKILEDLKTESSKFEKIEDKE